MVYWAQLVGSREGCENWSVSVSVLKIEPKLCSEDKMKCERQESGKKQAIISPLCTFIRVITPKNVSQHNALCLKIFYRLL